MNENMNGWSKRGLRVLAESQGRVRSYLLSREAGIKQAQGRRLVGAGQGFRQHVGLVDAGQQQALRDGEDSVLRRALIANGRHPAYQNGGAL